MELQAVAPGSAAGSASSGAMGNLGASDFLELMITQLTNQDPLEPTDNQALLEQLSSIREIQLSTTLTETLQTLTGHQGYTAAASLIGKEVSGVSGNTSTGLLAVSGRVTRVEFDDAGKATLHLDGGETLPIDRLRSVTDPNATPESLLGRLVRGRSPTEDDPSAVIEGIVTGFRREDGGRTVLELDTGEELNTSDLLAAV